MGAQSIFDLGDALSLLAFTLSTNHFYRLGYHLWQRPLKMASLVYEREIMVADGLIFETCEERRSQQRAKIVQTKVAVGAKSGVDTSLLIKTY